MSDFNPLSLISAPITGLFSAIGAGKQADAAKSAAATQATALTDAATISSKANDATIAYEQGQAKQTQANFETTQKANYDQWAATQARKSAYGQQFGLPAQNIPAYVPPTDTLGSLATTPPSTTTTPSANPTGSTSTNPTDPNAITAQLQANYKALGLTPSGPGSGPTDIGYYANQIAATGGLTPQNSAYWFGPSGRIASDAAKATGGGAAGATTPAAPTPTTTLGSYMPMSAPPITGTLSMPTAGNLASYFQGNG